MSRLVCWWSAGVTSAVAAKLALNRTDFDQTVIAYCASVEQDEHPDNVRFRDDCERWYDQPILRLYSENYASVDDVFEKRRYMAGHHGAPCTKALKREVREGFSRPDDTHVFGFDVAEMDRAAEFKHRNPALQVWLPLIERYLSHAECLALLRDTGIEIPAMYKLGYRNNNCIGCVKGGIGYWNKIRRDFPDVFAHRAEQSRRLNARLAFVTINGVRKHVFLDELPPDVGRYESEPAIECGIGCVEVAREVCGV